MQFEHLRCRLIVEHGGFATLGMLDKMIRIDALGVEIPGWEQTIIVELIERGPDGTLVERRNTPALPVIETLVTELRELGEAALEPVVDTGDGWERITLVTELDHVTRAWSLTMQWSGFRGANADRWRALFAQILELAGVGDHHHAWARR